MSQLLQAFLKCQCFVGLVFHFEILRISQFHRPPAQGTGFCFAPHGVPVRFRSTPQASAHIFNGRLPVLRFKDRLTTARFALRKNSFTSLTSHKTIHRIVLFGRCLSQIFLGHFLMHEVRTDFFLTSGGYCFYIS